MKTGPNSHGENRSGIHTSSRQKPGTSRIKDYGFRRHDDTGAFSTFYEFINFGLLANMSNILRKIV